jgi:serine/threonine-protein kinase
VSIDEHGSTLAASGGGERSVVGARYEILGLLGSGGMGNVYRARDRELDEVVALKLLRPEVVAAAGALDRFRREVKLARRVTHPNVARVFDIGEHGGDRILTMELVDGESLAAITRRERLPLARVVEIARAICAGVGAAHAAGVVHRDLKPDNVLVAKDGRVVVTDFGIARAAAEGSRTLGFVGTPAYMAPEQIDERATIDHRVDVYALGAVIYELLIGEPAWQAESLWALAAARLLQPPPDPREKRPELPTALCDLVIACMARAPNDRPQTMADVDQRLSSIVLPTTLAPSPRPPSPAAVAPTTGTDKRVAVLPFTSAPDQDYVADGLTEDLIDSLSVARGLRVRSRGAVMQYKGASRDARDVGRELDVNVVVEGSVRRSASGFRVSARLVSVADGFQLWARKFDVTDAEILAQNDVIARAIADALTVDLGTAPGRAAADARAVDLYLRARHAYHSSFSSQTNDAVALFDEVLAITPDDPRALAGRALAGSQMWLWTPSERQAAYDAAERAVQLAPSLADAHTARGAVRYHDGDSIGAIAPLRRALKLAPGTLEAHESLGRLLCEVPRPEAAEHLRTAIALEPNFEFPYINLARYHALRGERDQVWEIIDRARARGLKAAVPVEARFVLWWRDRERAKALRPSFDMRIPTHAGSRAWVELVVEGTVPTHAGPPLPAAAETPKLLRLFWMQMDVEVAMYVGDHERALGVLHALDTEKSNDAAWLEGMPLLDPLRSDPRFAPIRASFAARARAIGEAYERGDGA